MLCKNGDSLKSQSNIEAPLTPRQMERELRNLQARFLAMEDEFRKLLRRSPSNKTVTERLSKAQRETMKRLAGFERRLSLFEQDVSEPAASRRGLAAEA